MLLSPRDLLNLWADLGLSSSVSEVSILSFSLPVFPGQKECSPRIWKHKGARGHWWTCFSPAPLHTFAMIAFSHSYSAFHSQSFSTHTGDLTPQPCGTAVQKEAASNTFFFPPSQLSDQTHKRYSPVCTHKATTWKAGGTWKGQEGHRLCYTYTLSKSGPSMYNQFKTARLEERFLLMPPGKHQKMLLGTIPADTAIVTASKAKKKYCCLLLGVF